MASDKTNVMRILEQRHISYIPHTYPHSKEAVDGITVARLLGQDERQVFKTLIARGKQIHVFVIPAAETLDLKKAAKAAGEKSVELIAVKELQPLTGYVRGGCSPIGMKKAYPVIFDKSVEALPTVMVSAGKIGWQVECRPQDILAVTGASTAALTTATAEVPRPEKERTPL